MLSSFVGSPLYMAPEIFNNKSYSDKVINHKRYKKQKTKTKQQHKKKKKRKEEKNKMKRKQTHIHT